MINHPALLALVAWSLLGSVAMLAAGAWAGRILRGWNPALATEDQLLLERATTLVSTIVAAVLVFQVLSFFLFILAAEELHGRFVGAMCAAGTLNVNRFGYPALGFKFFNAVLGGAWCLLNRLDGQGHDFPLLRAKYRLLLGLAPLLILGEILQGLFFANLKADVITSCCGSLFGQSDKALVSELTSLSTPMAIGLWGGLALITLIAGGIHLRRGSRPHFFSLASILWTAAGVVVLVSALSVYIYELPTHHCPFCMLKPEYQFVGYAFYGLLLVQGVASLALMVFALLPSKPSISEALPRMIRRLVWSALLAGLIFGLLGLFSVFTSTYVGN